MGPIGLQRVTGWVTLGCMTKTETPFVMGPLEHEHTSDSANIAFYRERATAPDEDYVWVSVLYSSIQCDPISRAVSLKAVPDYHITVYRSGAGEVARFTYTPNRRPSYVALPARTLAGLIRREMAT